MRLVLGGAYVRNLIVLLLVVAGVVASGCGGTPPVRSGDAGVGANSISGVVVKGPVANGRVVAYRLDPSTFARVGELGRAQTDETGAFALPMSTVSGPVLVVASTGTYQEEAVGLGVKLDGVELVALVPNFRPGATVEGLRVTPVSTWAAALAIYHAQHGSSLVDAHAEAVSHLNAHFGGVDWTAVTPADFSVPGVTNLSPEAKAGLVLGGLSWVSKLHAETAQLQPGLVLNAATLTAALAQDAADGTFDGVAGAAQLKQATSSLSGLTLRSELVRGITGFANSPRNASSLQMSDITAFLAAIGTDADPYLFCLGQQASSSCGSGPVDTEPPTVTFLKPHDGAGVAGSVNVEVRGADNVKLASLHFSAPPSLVEVAPLVSADGRTATLTATLDVSAMPDGPVVVRAEATDDSGNPAAKAITITVSNKGPRVSITSPSEGVTVKGTVTIAATATAQAPDATITKLELVTPPAGIGADVLPAADSLSVSWDSAKAPEGPTALTLRATDSFGTATETAITVNVDNVAYGRVSAAVSAGPGVDGLTVRLVAIDDATGLPVVGREGGPILGESESPTVDGGVSFVLTQENYVGPVQLVASGPSASYADPSDESTLITLPATFSFSSYVARYRTGDSLSLPVTLWTTLADSAALAYLQGRNPSQPTPVPLTDAMAVVDPLFSTHVTMRPWRVRNTTPVRLTTVPQSLRDVLYAALPDVALNRLARELAEEVGLTPGTGLNAPMLADLLQQDIADGLFDGQASGMPLRTAGERPYTLDPDTTRFRSAIALDAFVRSPANRTGLKRVDLQTSAIFDAISGDTSILYPSDAEPIPFDNVPPTVAWTITFTNGPKTRMSPLGAELRVGGVLSVVADASDRTGVASISVNADAEPVDAAAGSTSSHLVGTYDTRDVGDGPLQLVATACDRLANCGQTTLTLIVDNTAPSFTVAAPAAAVYYSRMPAIDATAADAAGIASHVVSTNAVAALGDTDPEPRRVSVPYDSAGTVIPAGVSDGALTFTFTATDAVGNVATRVLSAMLDRTPPELTYSTPAAFTNVASVAFSTSALDYGAGTTKTWLQVNGGTERTAGSGDECIDYGGGEQGCDWTVALKPGNNVLKVWAEDAAVPPNGSSAALPPYVATVTTSLDQTPPTVLSQVSPASYVDERSFTVERDSTTGRPTMPVKYLTSAGKVAVNEGGVIYKMLSRSGANDTNIPVLQWTVQVEPLPAAPIVSGSYAITYFMDPNDSGNFEPAHLSGPLRLVASPPNTVVYELAVHAGLFGGVAPGGIVSMRVDFADAAGNTRSRSFQLTYHLIGPPLVILRDDAYSSYPDARLFRVRPGSGGLDYAAVIGAESAAVRWVVYNPNAEAARVDSSSTARPSWTEQWIEKTNNVSGAMTYDGQTWPQRQDWYSDLPDPATIVNIRCGTDWGNPANINPFPCDWGTKPVHYIGDSGNYTRCEDRGQHEGGGTGPYPLSHTVAATLAHRAYQSPLPTAGETTPAAWTSYGWSVPAASGTTPGSIVIYSTVTTPARPFTGVLAQQFPIDYGFHSFPAGVTYKLTVPNSQQACFKHIGFDMIYYYNQGWTGRYFARTLSSFAFNFSGTQTFLSTSAPPNDFGLYSVDVPSQSFAVTLNR